VVDEEGSRLLGALLNGVNKALPLLRTVEPLIKHISALFRMVHTSSFAASTQALALLAFLAIDSNANIGSEGHSSIKRRYYRALYTKLLSDDVRASSIFYNIFRFPSVIETNPHYSYRFSHMERILSS
jgi:hypothetical protein